jgi:GH24 family phage-related lysozyme (muramidase)
VIASLGTLSHNVTAALVAFSDAIGVEQFEKSACYRFMKKGELRKARNQIIVMARKPYLKDACENALYLWDNPEYDTSYIDEFQLPVYDWGVLGV